MPININNISDIKARRLLHSTMVHYRLNFISIFRMP
jgi:hypothetical protein